MEKDCMIPSVSNSSKCVSVALDMQATKKLTKTTTDWIKLVGINLFAFGLELCASAGFTYIPPVMLKNGFSEKTLSVVMGIGPFISLLFVPVIGRWSDKCQSRFGRRRPFMLFLGFLTILSLLIIPFSTEIFVYTQGIIGANFVLASGVILLDFAGQAVMNPCKALIPDIFASSSEQNAGFTFYSCMLSLGGCVGYLMTCINWGNTHLGMLFGGQEKAVFSMLSVFLFLLLIANLRVAKEIPFQRKKMIYSNGYRRSEPQINGLITIQEKNIFIDEEDEILLKKKIWTSNGLTLLDVNSIDQSEISSYSPRSNKRMFVPYLQLRKFRGALRTAKTVIKYLFCSIFYPLHCLYAIKLSILNFFNMPSVLFRLFSATLFSWMGIMCHDLYYTDFVGQVIYQGKPKAEKESIAVNLYDEGVRMGSWGLLLHSLSAALYAGLIQERLIAIHGQRKVYLSGMILFCLCLFGTILTNSILLMNIFAVLSGMGLAVITTLPYSLVTEYYNAKEVYYGDSNDRGIGEDMAVLDSAFYLSQIIPSLFLGYVVDVTGSSSAYMVVAVVCAAAGSYLAFFITFPTNVSSFE